MSIIPNSVIGDIELEIRNRIAGNLVYCQVNPEVLVDECWKSTVENDGTWTIGNTQVSLQEYIRSVKQEISTARYNKEFTQVGDKTRVCVHNFESGTVGDKADDIIVKLECTNSIMNNAMSHIYGFRLKDRVKSSLIQKYASKPLIIPAQIFNHDLFAQRPIAGGLKLNTNITLTNCTNIALSFPQTDNEITVAKVSILKCHLWRPNFSIQINADFLENS